jgi:hypothetical protein
MTVAIVTTECFECGGPLKGPTCPQCNFEPCVIYREDAGVTELVLTDVPTVWVTLPYGDIELGYHMDSGALVAVRIPGNFTVNPGAFGDGSER